MNATYRIVIKGVRDGFTKDQVAKQLASWFKVTEERIHSKLDTSSFVVIDGLDFQTTEKYKAAVEQRGCVCAIEMEMKPTSQQVPTTADLEPVLLVKKGGNRICRQCGIQLPITDTFCSGCGARQSTEMTNTAQVTSTPVMQDTQAKAFIVSHWGRVMSMSLKQSVLVLVVLLVCIYLWNEYRKEEWVRVGTNGDSTHYVDRASIHTTGNMVQMWDMWSTTDRNENLEWHKTKIEYDCKKKLLRILNMSSKDVDAYFIDFERGSMMEEKWKFACGKR